MWLTAFSKVRTTSPPDTATLLTVTAEPFTFTEKVLTFALVIATAKSKFRTILFGSSSKISAPIKIGGSVSDVGLFIDFPVNDSTALSPASLML